MNKRIVRIGSRDSKLAVMQTELMIHAVTKYHPEIQFELVTMKTTGDIILNQTLDKIGGKGLFVKELDIALAEGRIDCCVHSLKDMPMEENPDFPITALPKRGDPRDVLVLPQMQHFENITAQNRFLQLSQTTTVKKAVSFLPLLACTRQYHYQIAKTGLRRIFFFGISRRRITACGII